MLKKILLGIFILAFALLVYAVYYHFRQTGTPANRTFQAVPLNAILIIESPDILGLRKKLDRDNPVWSRLSQMEWFASLNRNGAFLDSLAAADPVFTRMLQFNPSLISLHRSGAKQIDFLFIFSMPSGIDVEDIEKSVSRIPGNTGKNIRDYDNAKITEIVYKVNQSSGEQKNFIFTYTVYSNLFIAGLSPMLVEDAVRQINSGTSLPDLKEFAGLARTSDKKAEANIYLNFARLPELLGLFMRQEYGGFLKNMEHFAFWTGGDIKTGNDEISFNGFTMADDSSACLLNVFSRRQPPELRAPSLIPDHAAFYLGYGLLEPMEMNLRYRHYLEATGRLYEYENLLKKIQQDAPSDFHNRLLEWVGNEAGFFITRPDSTNFLYNCFLAVHCSSTESFSRMVKEMGSDPVFPDTLQSMTYKDYGMNPFPAAGFTALFPANPFPPDQPIWYTVMDEFIVFGCDPAPLCRIIDSYTSGRTLKNSANFIYLSDKQSSSAALTLLVNINSVEKIAARCTEKNIASSITPFFDNAEKGKAGFLALQFFAGDDLIFTNSWAGIFDNRQTEPESHSVLWAVKTDTVFSGTPWLVTNHLTGMKEIFIQDEGNNLYLLDASGSVLWKRKIQEKIKGEVFQVDALKNKKLQLLFSTVNWIHLIDRKGNYVEGFPLRLPAPATNGVAVFDYDKNREYRILIACRDKKIYCYDVHGTKVEGWKFDGTSSPVFQPIRQFSLKGKDCIVMVDSAGKIYSLDRKGSDRMEIKQTLPVSPNNTFYLDLGGDISQSSVFSTDSTGTIRKIYFSNKTDTIVFETFSSDHYFTPGDLDGDGAAEYIYLDKDMLQVFGRDKESGNYLQENIFAYTFNRFAAHPPLILKWNDNSARIGVVIEKTSEIYIFRSDGVVEPGFPLNGTTPFATGDLIKSGIFHLIGGTQEGINNYQLVTAQPVTVTSNTKGKKK